MCNINALYRKKGEKSTTGFIQSISANSFSHNNHGEGVYFSSSDRVFKNKDKIDYVKFQEEIENSKLVLTHQRWSTSGFEVKYNHPFANEDFIFVHNGVINQFLGNSGSDSSGFFNRFVKEFNLDETTTSRQNKIIKVLRDLFKEDSGSYSILIYDKKTKDSYYFKNTPAIHFYKNEDFLLITTESDNAIYLPMISGKKFIELEIKKREIYHIDKNFEVYHLARLPEDEIIVEDENIKKEESEKSRNTNLNDWGFKQTKKEKKWQASKRYWEEKEWDEVNPNSKKFIENADGYISNNSERGLN